MHKRARPRRETLTSPPPAPKFLSNREGHPGHHHPLVALGHAAPGANGRSGGFGGAESAQAGILSPVSHCAQKLGTLHHWTASPGSANPPATAARPAGAPGHPFGLGATPHPLTVEPSAGGRFAPATAATPFDRHAADFRRDLAPIRSTCGLTFAEALARNSSGGARPIHPPPDPSVHSFKPRETNNDARRATSTAAGVLAMKPPILPRRAPSRSRLPRSRS